MNFNHIFIIFICLHDGGYQMLQVGWNSVAEFFLKNDILPLDVSLNSICSTVIISICATSGKKVLG
jgi:hypothetical protein